MKTETKVDTRLTIVIGSNFFFKSQQRNLVAIFAGLQIWTKTPGAREKVSPSKLPTANVALQFNG